MIRLTIEEVVFQDVTNGVQTASPTGTYSVPRRRAMRTSQPKSVLMDSVAARSFERMMMLSSTKRSRLAPPSRLMREVSSARTPLSAPAVDVLMS
jgi:hypothetical protein